MIPGRREGAEVLTVALEISEVKDVSISTDPAGGL